MKILLTTDTFQPMINGVVISICNLYKELKNNGHDVKILTLSPTGEEKILGDIYYLKSFKVKIYPGLRAKVPFFNKLVSELIEWKPDIIHSQTEFSTMLISKKIAHKVMAPHIHTYHTLYEEYLKYLWKGKLLSKNMANELTKVLLNSLEAVIAPSEKVKNTLEHYGVVKNIYVIPTGIDLNKFKKKITAEEKEKILSLYELSRKKVLVYIGRIAEEKNIEEVIEYFSYACNDNKVIALLIVGGGPYLQNLKDLVKLLKLEDKIKFTGMIDPDEVYKYYQLAEAFVTSSTSETQGLTYIEALSSGIPVICRYDSCIEKLIIDNENGFKFNNREEFKREVDLLTYEEKLVEKLHFNAAMKAEEYSQETFGKNIIQLYKEVLYNFKYMKWQKKLIANLKIWI